MFKPVYAANAPDFAPPAQLSELENVFSNVVTAILGLAGIALFVMLIIAGFQFITAGADPAKAEAARKTATSAILGLVLVAASYLILTLISSFLGTPQLLDFTIFYGN